MLRATLLPGIERRSIRATKLLRIRMTQLRNFVRNFVAHNIFAWLQAT